MSKATHFTLALGLVAAAFLAAACRDAVTPEEIGPPSFGPPPQPPKKPPACPALKMTGGGRIDFPPGGPDKNDPASHEYETFGAHVIQGDENGNCQRKGSLQWVDHRLGQKIGTRPLNLHSVTIDFAVDISDEPPWDRCDDGAVRWGGTLRVKNTDEVHEFIVEDCDNGEPGAKHDAFELNVPGLGPDGYFVRCDGFVAGAPDRRALGDPPGCVLTGGNRQFHKPKA